MAFADIQKRTFTKWVNVMLKVRGMHIEDLDHDLKNGVLLINLLEVLSQKKIPVYNKHPRVINQKYENNNIAIDFITKEGIKLVNIGSEDLTDGRPKLILGLIWTLILHYQVASGGSDQSAKNDLLQWVRSKIPEYDIKGFTKDWNDGRALNGLVDALAPGAAPGHRGLDPSKGNDNNSKGMDLAHENLGIPYVIAPEDLANPKVDEQSVMTYISYFRNAAPSKRNYANECEAYGPGLVEGIVNETSEFSVVAPKGHGKLEVKVEGPKNNAKVEINKTVLPNGDTKYDIKYKPDIPGEWKVHVTCDGQHIPGSIFHVTVLDAISLGGEGKIRVFYSTTASSEKGRSDVKNLQSLLEVKKIHQRPDFEPWIPVDTMDKGDRDLVFKKAGTKALPIVYVDDKYIGDYDTIQELEEVGKLNVLINFKIK
jgi:filamin